jgi:hypothetical protein
MGELLLYFVAVLRRIRGHKIVDQRSDLGGRYWDRTSDLFGVNTDFSYVRAPGSVLAHR